MLSAALLHALAYSGSILTKRVSSPTLRVTMSSHFPYVVMLAVAIAGAISPRSFSEDALEARPAALLLRNGEVLEGRVSAEGDYYAVLLARGELRLRRQQVVAIEPSVEAIYATHIAAKATEGVDGHVERADWCLRHNLLGYAAGEITQAQRAEPTSRRVATLVQRLEIARRPRKLAPKPTQRPDVPPAAQLAGAADSVDPHALETFTSAVQPLLLNRCANAACHGRNTVSKFRLQRGVEGRPIPRALTLANLSATIKHIDRTSPTASALLTTPIRPHGKAKQAVFLQQHRKQYELLARWVEDLRDGERPAAIVLDAKDPSTEPHRRPMGINAKIDALARPLVGEQRKKPAPTERQSSDGAKPIPVKPELDPFDPEQFNRQFFKNRAKAKRAD